MKIKNIRKSFKRPFKKQATYCFVIIRERCGVKMDIKKFIKAGTKTKELAIKIMWSKVKKLYSHSQVNNRKHTMYRLTGERVRLVYLGKRTIDSSFYSKNLGLISSLTLIY